MTFEPNLINVGWKRGSGRNSADSFGIPLAATDDMSSTSQIVDVLWYAHPLLQAVVAAVLWRRKLFSKFPAFFAYLLAQIVLFAAALYVVGRFGTRGTSYLWLYCFDVLASAVLAFRVIHEVFLDVFRPYHTLKDLGTIVFKWAGVVMLLVAVVVAFSNSTESDPLVRAVTIVERSVRLVQIGLILFLLLFSRFLGVSRRQTSFGIALGFGLYAGVDLMVLALRSGGLIQAATGDLAAMSAYNLGICIWLAYTLTASTARDATVSPLQTQRWEQGLADLHPAHAASNVPDDSLIPMFEGMVERAFSRNSALTDTESPLQYSRIPETSQDSSAAAAAAVGSRSRA